MYKNDSSDFYTERSSGKPGRPGFSKEETCKYNEEKSSSEDERIEGTGPCGPGASTTGNITRIYDMSGSAKEWVMGNYENTKGDSNFEDSF